jgi:hypothetical protein
MNAVDAWLVVSAVLLGLATLFGFVADNPRVTASRITALPLVAGGLLCYVISVLVSRHP